MVRWFALAWLCGLLLALSVAAANAQAPGACSGWTQANDGAFGLGTGADSDYSNEEGFEVLVSNDQLYLGMEADNSLGARVWRTKSGIAIPRSQADWEEVAADASGNPFGVADKRQNDHIDSLAEFGGYIYASTANRSGFKLGTRVFRSSSGAASSWSDAVASPTPSPGFGDVNNENLKDVIVFTVAGTDWLCGGTWHEIQGAQVWCTSDGTNWTQTNASGFGNVKNMLITSSSVFSGNLYFGVSNTDENSGSVWRTSDLSSWTEVYTSTDRPRVEIMGVYSGNMYIAEGASDGRRSDDPTIRVYRSGNGTSWTQVGSELDDDAHNTRTIVDGATVYNNAFYLAVMNSTTGVEIWRTDGTSWTHVTAGNEGFGDSDTFAAELIPFNGYLYAWTSNYTTGQQVMRTKCPIEETLAVSQTGVNYTFSDPINATVNFSDLGSVTQVTAQVYPDAWATGSVETAGQRPVKRHYVISANGADFTADLTLSYTQAEFDASNVAGENTTYLTRWTGSAWSDCLTGSRDVDANTVTCRDVAAFSTWAIAGSGASPTAVGLRSFRDRSGRSVAQRLLHWSWWTWPAWLK